MPQVGVLNFQRCKNIKLSIYIIMDITYKQKGGVIINPKFYDLLKEKEETEYPYLSSLYYFVLLCNANGEITPLGDFNSSLYGCNVRCKLNNLDSIPFNNLPYLSTDNPGYGKPVPEIIIKFSLHQNSSTSEEEYLHINNILKGVSSLDSFKNEVSIQQSIFAKTVESGYSVCPGICFASIIGSISTDNSKIILKDILRIILDKLDDYSSINQGLKSFIKYVDTGPYFLGMIAMPMLSGYKTLDTHINEDRNILEILKPVCYQYYRLMHMGIRHGDFHTGNVMINNTTGKCKIIDFGRTVEEVFDKTIRENYNDDNIINMYSQIKNMAIGTENLLFNNVNISPKIFLSSLYQVNKERITELRNLIRNGYFINYVIYPENNLYHIQLKGKIGFTDDRSNIIKTIYDMTREKLEYLPISSKMIKSAIDYEEKIMELGQYKNNIINNISMTDRYRRLLNNNDLQKAMKKMKSYLDSIGINRVYFDPSLSNGNTYLRSYAGKVSDNIDLEEAKIIVGDSSVGGKLKNKSKKTKTKRNKTKRNKTKRNK
jgi:serine/threonine protein kinase